MNAITTGNLTLHYGRRIGIDGVNLAVPVGSIFGFLGPNGAGKTTTIRILLGFMRAQGGAAQILDLDCWRRSKDVRKRVGYVPGDLRLYPWMTARSALGMVAAVRGIDLVAEGLALAERFTLDPTIPSRKMSRGTRQKLGLVLALAGGPDLLILDEPTTGLDPLMRIELAECLRERAANGTTVFFSSHTLSEVEQLCDRVAIVRAGKIVTSETLDALRKRAQRRIGVEFQSAEKAAAVTSPDFLGDIQRNGPQWQAELTGSSAQLIQWAAAQNLADLSISAPDLETVFRAYYTARPDGEDS